MTSSAQGKTPAIHAVITEAAVETVGDHLRWNEAAYGKAWTGEDEDTRFLCYDVADKVTAALDAAGFQIVRKPGA